MIDLTLEKQRQCEKSGWKTFRLGKYEVSLGDITSKIIIWLNKFKEIGDIIVQYDPVHAALPVLLPLALLSSCPGLSRKP